MARILVEINDSDSAETVEVSVLSEEPFAAPLSVAQRLVCDFVAMIRQNSMQFDVVREYADSKVLSDVARGDKCGDDDQNIVDPCIVAIPGKH